MAHIGRVLDDTGPLRDLTPREAEFLTSLLTEATVTSAAEKVGLSQRTAFHYLEDPGFKEAYRKARQQVVHHALAQIQTCASEAVDTLRKVMKDSSASSRSRVSAAKAVVETAVKVAELEEVEQRLRIVESLLALE